MLHHTFKAVLSFFGPINSLLAPPIVGLVIVMAPSTSFALDLNQTLSLAQQHDAELQAAHAEYAATIEIRSQSTAAMLPAISLDVFTRKTSTEVTQSSGVLPPGQSDFDTDGYTLSLDQVIYNHSLFKDLATSSALLAQAKVTLEAAKQDLIVRTASAYFDVLAAHDNLVFARAEKKAIARQLEQSRERFNVGLIAITDVKESQARFDTAVAAAIIAENTLDNARENLWVIINTPADDLNPMREKIPLVIPEPQDIDAWKHTALENNLNLLAAQYAMEAAQSTHEGRRGEHYPTLSLNASHGTSDSDGSSFDPTSTGTERDDTVVELQLNIPIYSGGFTSSRARQSAAELNLAKARYQQQQRQTTQQTRSAYLGIQAAISQVKALKQAVVSTQTAAEATKAGYDAGTRTGVDVLLAQREVYKSQRDYWRARYDYILNVLEIKRAAGTLSAIDIEEINQWLVH